MGDKEHERGIISGAQERVGPFPPEFLEPWRRGFLFGERGRTQELEVLC